MEGQQGCEKLNCDDVENVSLCPSIISQASTVGGKDVLSSSMHACMASSVEEESATRDVKWGLDTIYSIIPGRLSFAVFKSQKHAFDASRNHPQKQFVTSAMQELYQPLISDFGPVNLGVVHAFCVHMRQLLTKIKKELVYFSMDAVDVRTNCAFLLASLLVVEMKFSAEDAWKPFQRIRGNAFATFRDAADTVQDYDLTILSCLQGLSKAMSLGWYSPKTFDADEYAALDDPSRYDMHMMTPKFAAFKGPVERKRGSKLTESAKYAFPPEHFVDVFRAKGISAVVRFNEPCTYDPASFTKAGLVHYDMYFDDCTVPNNSTVMKFLTVAEHHDKIAIHCTAGLGRTGTLIAAYMMKHNGFTAAESIGWLRIVRPGSVIGQQQHYLHFLERAFRVYNRSDLPSLKCTSVEVSAAMGRQIAKAQQHRTMKRIAAQEAAKQHVDVAHKHLVTDAGSVAEGNEEASSADVDMCHVSDKMRVAVHDVMHSDDEKLIPCNSG